MEMEDTKTLAGIIARANSVMAISKKLTTKDRKGMKESTFCGPNRSFPVPDCKHVAVAKAYLKKSKFSDSTKKKIAACINRKAKKLGCTVSKKAKASNIVLEDWQPVYIELSYEQKQLYSSDVFKTTRDLVEQSLKSPGMDVNFTDIIK
jgi:hypothetical protein